MLTPLVHYIVVRRDLPVGVVYAQIAHAAGESFYLFSRSSEKEHSAQAERSLVQVQPGDPPFDPAQTIAVVLGARNEGKLARLELELLGAGIPHVSIREVDGPFAGSLMAIGLVPGPKDELLHYVNDFHMFREAPTELSAARC